MMRSGENGRSEDEEKDKSIENRGNPLSNKKPNKIVLKREPKKKRRDPMVSGVQLRVRFLLHMIL